MQTPSLAPYCSTLQTENEDNFSCGRCKFWPATAEYLTGSSLSDSGEIWLPLRRALPPPLPAISHLFLRVPSRQKYGADRAKERGREREDGAECVVGATTFEYMSLFAATISSGKTLKSNLRHHRARAAVSLRNGTSGRGSVPDGRRPPADIYRLPKLRGPSTLPELPFSFAKSSS